jgi:hypothetical protein
MTCSIHLVGSASKGAKLLTELGFSNTFRFREVLHASLEKTKGKDGWEALLFEAAWAAKEIGTLIKIDWEIGYRKEKTD